MSDRVTDEQAAVWQALCERATEGPWFVEHAVTDDGLSIIDDGRTSPEALHSIYAEAHDAALIAAAPTAVRALLDEREELRERAEAAERERTALIEIVDQAIRWFRTMTSADGSGHADLGDRLAERKERALRREEG